MQTWTAQELRTFLEHDPEDPQYYAWVLAGTTGMRRSEVLGVRWRDVDLIEGRLVVRRASPASTGAPSCQSRRATAAAV